MPFLLFLNFTLNIIENHYEPLTEEPWASHLLSNAAILSILTGE